MSLLTIRAGKRAYQQIQEKNLAPGDIGSVFGASGAAKWLTISALDAAIFGQWLTPTQQPVHLYGTSVGAWKLAIAAQTMPGRTLAEFAQAYCRQQYGKSIDHADVWRETNKIIAAMFTPDKIQHILTNPQFRFHCGAVVCRGLLASESKPALALAMIQAGGLNLIGHRYLRYLVERVVFCDHRDPPPLNISDHIPTHTYPLTTENFVAAITASGSIPYVMAGITNIPGADPGMYRDGGLIDYHPLPGNLWREEKLILYPHFYSHIAPGWFDKSLPWRRAKSSHLDNVVLISPSPSYVHDLPGGRIPDRQDFMRFKGNNAARIAQWQVAIASGRNLAAEFLDSVNSDKFRHRVQPL